MIPNNTNQSISSFILLGSRFIFHKRNSNILGCCCNHYISKDDTQEFIVENRGGRSLVVEVSASKVTSSSGELAGRMASFVDITKRKEIEADREKLIGQLKDALAKIKTLKGIIPICAACKKIRDDKGYWNQLEIYLREHSEADFRHGICPECVKELYPELHHKLQQNAYSKKRRSFSD